MDRQTEQDPGRRGGDGSLSEARVSKAELIIYDVIK